MKIVISTSCRNEVLLFAAQELRRYLLLCFPEMDICRPVDKDKADGLQGTHIILESTASTSTPEAEADSYQIAVAPQGGLIKGASPRSTLLGVYAYLRHIGVRFLRPGKQWEYIPKTIDYKCLWVSFKACAEIRHRGICIEGATSLENILDTIDWLPKLGFNSFFIQFKSSYEFMRRWYTHQLNPYVEKESFDLNRAQAYDLVVEEALLKRGLWQHRAGHGWTGEAIGIPSMGWAPEHHQPSATIASFLAKVKGERRFFQGVPANTNLCYSNKDVIEMFSHAVVDYAQRHPEIDFLHVWLADEHNNICECSACQKELPTDQYIKILNRCDELLSEKGLTTKLVFVLYQELLYAPVHQRLVHPERFVLMFAPISRTYEASYPERIKKEAHSPYIRNQISLPINLDENLTFLADWQDCFPGDSLVYDYPLGRAHYGDFGYMAISKIISQDLKQLSKLGLNGYISCQELRAAFPTALPNYVMGYTLFDTSVSFDELVREYFEAAFGDDFHTALMYLQRLSALSSCDYFNGKGSRLDEAVAQNYAKVAAAVREFVLPVQRAYERATGLQKKFWETLIYHQRYVKALAESLKALAQGKIDEANTHFFEFHALICKNENRFQNALDVYRVTEVATKYTGFTLAQEKEFSDVQKQGAKVI